MVTPIWLTGRKLGREGARAAAAGVRKVSRMISGKGVIVGMWLIVLK